MPLGGRRSKEKMTKCDMGGGRIKKPDFRSDILFAWPRTTVIKTMLIKIPSYVQLDKTNLCVYSLCVSYAIDVVGRISDFLVIRVIV